MVDTTHYNIIVPLSLNDTVSDSSVSGCMIRALNCSESILSFCAETSVHRKRTFSRINFGVFPVRDAVENLAKCYQEISKFMSYGHISRINVDDKRLQIYYFLSSRWNVFFN